MKKIIISVIVFLLGMGVISKAYSLEDVNFDGGDLSEELLENIQKADEDFSFEETVKEISKGSYSADLRGVVQKTLDMLFEEIRLNGKIMATIIILIILCTLLSNLAIAFPEGGIKDASFLCCYAILAGLTSTGFMEITETVKSTIGDMGVFMRSIIPVLTSLSASEGRVIFAPFMHTQILMATALSSFLMEKVLLPLSYITFALKFINNMTSSLSLGSLCTFLDKAIKRTLSFMLLIFTAVLTLTSFAAGTGENMGMKTLRFALSSTVPFAGGALAESVTAMTASCAMIKNSIGLAGIIAIVLMGIYPVIKCGALSIIYNFTGALLEPVADKRLSLAVTSVGECMGLIFAMVSVCTAQYIISTAILISVIG